MKRMLLILMVLASAAMANDAKMKALLTGTWQTYCTLDKVIFQADGKWLTGGCDDPNPSKWTIKNGELLEIGGHEHSFTILLLTKHAFLAQLNARDGLVYFFLTRHDD
jgi:hypothetical protein